MNNAQSPNTAASGADAMPAGSSRTAARFDSGLMYSAGIAVCRSLMMGVQGAELVGRARVVRFVPPWYGVRGSEAGMIGFLSLGPPCRVAVA